MPKLTVTQWIFVAAFQVLYGLVVFAVTRDYYERVAAPRASAAVPHAVPAAPPAATPQSALPPVAMEAVQDDPVALARLGDVHFRQGQHETAIPLYWRAIELAPDDVDSFNDLGLSLHYAGRSDEAVGVLEEGVQRGPDYPRIWLTLGFVQLHRGERQAAAEALVRARDLGSETGVGEEARRLLAELEREAGSSPEGDAD
jgi:Flp pilus assembly protein TadD